MGRWCFKYQASFPLVSQTIGSFSNDDRDVNKNGKKAIGLLSKTTTLHMHHVFLYISLQSLHDYDVKMPNSRFVEDVNKRSWIFLSLFKLEYSPLRSQLKGNSPSFDIVSELEETRQSLKKRGFVLQVTFSLPSTSSMLKLPNKGRRTALPQFRGTAIEDLWRGGYVFPIVLKDMTLFKTLTE